MTKRTPYNKLVRDNVPEIIKHEYKKIPHTRILSDEEYAHFLVLTLHEEVQEYVQDKNTEELADILEVVYALGKVHNASSEDLENIRKEKAKKRGAFTKKVYLEFVEE